MRLIHIKHTKASADANIAIDHPTQEVYVLQAQDGDLVYETFPMNQWRMETMLIHAVAGLLALRPLNTTLPIECQQPVSKRPLLYGIGLTNDHKQFIRVVRGKPETIDSGYRWMVADAFRIYVGKAINDGTFLTGAV